MKPFSKIFCFIFLALAATGGGLPAREKAEPDLPTGSIQGEVRERSTQQLLAGAAVTLAELDRTVVSDDLGKFFFPDLPVGGYSLVCIIQGMEPVAVTDLIVKSGAVTRVSAEIDLLPALKEAVSVSAGYFNRAAGEPATVLSFSNEEIRRAPGAGGDVNRIIASLPGVSRTNDQANNLAVRGGSAAENLFLVDNIEVPNINHFPVPGSSSGPICLLNLDLIRDVDFYAGGFSAEYGDRLSAVMNLTLRQGERDRLRAQASLDMAGVGLLAEGPLPGAKGSWMVSVRRSYVDLLTSLMNAGATVRYNDINAKGVIEFSPRSRLTFLGIMGDDRSTVGREDSVEVGENVFGKMKTTEGTWGINWFWMPADRFYSNLSLSLTRLSGTDDWYDTFSGGQDFASESLENTWHLRLANHWTVGNGQALKFGLEAKRLEGKFDFFMAAAVNSLGEAIPEIRNRIDVASWKYGAFAEYGARIGSRFSANLGLRADFFAYNRHWRPAPRLSLRYDLTPRASIGAYAGLFRQTLPLLLAGRNPSNRELDDPSARQFGLTFQRLVTPDIRLSIESYYKDYRHVPVDPAEPSICILDDVFGRSLFGDGPLQDSGRARSYGVEVVLQKRLKEKVYGMICGSLFRSEYRDPEGTWRRRVFDNRYIFSIQGGYKPNRWWEFSASWTLAGGLPYTPFAIAASAAARAGIFDADRINAERLPAYHSLSLRADRRFHFRRSSLIVYLSIWNAYDRKNVASYYWNEVENRPGCTYQFGLLPVLGIEFEF
jgi:hypothetical protein